MIHQNKVDAGGNGQEVRIFALLHHEWLFWFWVSVPPTPIGPFGAFPPKGAGLQQCSAALRLRKTCAGNRVAHNCEYGGLICCEGM